MTIIFIFELIGTVAFAVSGAVVAVDKSMDLIGVVSLGMTTAVGGGIIRDVILGVVPPTAFQEPVYAILAVAVSLIVYIPKIRTWLTMEHNTILIFMDSLGLAVFTVIGVRAGIGYDNLFLSSFVGCLTGVGGGVLRDLFADRRPRIFTKGFYASASLIGAILASVLWRFAGAEFSMSCGALVVLVLRLLAARFRWNLPKA